MATSKSYKMFSTKFLTLPQFFFSLYVDLLIRFCFEEVVMENTTTTKDVYSRIPNPLEPVPKLNQFQIMELEY